MLFVAYYFSFRTFLAVFIISLLHALIDFAKVSFASKKASMENSVLLFFIDQIAHIFVILIAVLFINPDPQASSAVKNLLEQVVFSFVRSLAGITYTEKILLSLTLLVIGLWGVGIFIRILSRKMDWLKSHKSFKSNPKTEENRQADGTGEADEADGGGYLIGILERLFIIASIVFNIELVIGFILAAKSVARMKKFDKDSEVEYFIIGNLISFTAAIIIGYIIKLLITPIV